jgi:hypothetical protein
MSDRTERVAFYTDPETKRQLEKDADRADATLSTDVHNLVEQQLEADTREQRYRELNAEERLESLIADIKDIQARAGVYAVANWELLKQDHPDTVRQEALSTGSRRLHDPDSSTADPTDSTDVDERENQDETLREGERQEAEPYQEYEADSEDTGNIFDKLR